MIGCPSIVVLEPVYSLFTLHQAKRRAFRPTQTQDCEVTYVCYAGSMSEQAISIVARKSAAAAILNGDDLSNGLLEFDPGMSLLQELAQAVMVGDEDRTGLADDVRALLRDGATALKADLEAGAAGLISVAPTLDTRDVALVDATRAATPADAPAVPPTDVSSAAVDAPGLAWVGTAEVRLDAAPATDADANAAAPVQLALFGDAVAVTAKRPRRVHPTDTRGVPAAA